MGECLRCCVSVWSSALKKDLQCNFFPVSFTQDGNPAPAAPLNSDEVEEAEEVEAAEAEPAVTEAAPAEPGVDPAAVEPAVVDIPVDAAPVDAAADVDVPPVDVVPVDVAPEVAVDAGAGPLAAETDMTGVVADPAAL